MQGKTIAVLVAVTTISPAVGQATSEILGTNDAGETYLIDAKTIRSVEYPKATNGFFSVPPQTAAYRETWVRSVKESKITGQYL